MHHLIFFKQGDTSLFYSVRFLKKCFICLFLLPVFISCEKNETSQLEEEIPKVTSIEIIVTNQQQSLQKNATIQLSLKIVPADAVDKTVIWTSSNETVAQVSSEGLVTAVGVGKATISVKSNNNKSINDSVDVDVVGNTTNDITSFSVNGNNGIVIGEHTLGIQVPVGTDLSHFLPTIEHNGETIDPSTDEPQDFTQPVIYTVTSESGEAQDWVIKIIAIQEVPNSPGFITKWVTTNPGLSDDNSVEIPTYPIDVFNYDYNYNIDWGDGNIEENLSGNAKHTYEIPGVYYVSITGGFPRLFFNSNSYGEDTDRQKITLVNQWGNIQWRDLSRAFKGCTELDVVAQDSPNLSNVFGTIEMFRDCHKLVGNSSFENWDVSNVSYSTLMFGNCYLFNQNIGNWDVSNMVAINGMFQNAHAFNQDIGNWDLSNVVHMQSMFGGAISFNQDIGNWYFPKALNLCKMFQGAKAFNQDISLWDVSKIEDFSAMFNGAVNFNQPIGSWDMSSAVDLAAMFQSANAFKGDITNWNVSNVKNMAIMFANNITFNQDISGWDVSNVEDIVGLFWNNPVFNQDLSEWNVSNVTSMQKMFKGATAFDQSLGNWDINKVNNMFEMFDDTKLSKENYDATLNGWNSLSSLQKEVAFDGGNSNYCNSETARQNLVDVYNWTISDAGKKCD